MSAHFKTKTIVQLETYYIFIKKNKKRITCVGSDKSIKHAYAPVAASNESHEIGLKANPC